MLQEPLAIENTKEVCFINLSKIFNSPFHQKICSEIVTRAGAGGEGCHRISLSLRTEIMRRGVRRKMLHVDLVSKVWMKDINWFVLSQQWHR
jgi:hypothetical protein